MKLPKGEKASRFDSLQCSFQIMLDIYRRQQKDAERSWEGGKDPELIRAYNKGRADALCDFIQVLERWKEAE